MNNFFLIVNKEDRWNWGIKLALEIWLYYTELLKCAVLGTCATFSATSPVAQTEKGGAGCSGAKVKNNGAVAVAQKKALIRALSAPFSNQIFHRNIYKLILLWRLKIPKFEEREWDCGQTIKHSTGLQVQEQLRLWIFCYTAQLNNFFSKMWRGGAVALISLKKRLGGAVAQWLKRWLMRRWRELKKVARAQHWKCV